MENRSTPTPASRATTKCPNSWTRIKIPRTSTKATIVVTAALLLPLPGLPALSGRRARERLRVRPSPHERPRPGIHVDAGLDAVESAVRHACERLGDELRDLGEADLPAQEGRHRHLVGRVQDHRRAPALEQRVAGRSEE